MRNPRQHRRYTEARAAWLAGFRGASAPCCLCGRPVDTTLPGRAKWGPTIEHLTPVRHILAVAQSDAEALAMATDTSRWALAHLACQRRQGGRVRHKRRPTPPRTIEQPSRQW